MACNLRCRHCGSSAGLVREGELTTEEALGICDQLPSLMVREVDFTGGEPLLRPDWPVVAARLVELGITTNILTNGLDLDERRIAQMQDVGIAGVGISLDGLAASHDFTRNRAGAFASVMRSIDLMHEASLPFNVITTVNSRNIDELSAMAELLLAAGVNFWRLQGIIPMGRVRENASLMITKDDVLRLGRFIRGLRGTLDSSVMQIICSDGLEYVVASDQDERPWQGCSAGIISCGITSDGKIKGCLSMPDELIEGDLRKKDLWDIWFDANAFGYTRQFSTDRLGDNCAGCEKAAECKGGCSSSSYCSTGRFHNDPYCFYKAECSATG